MRTPDATVNFKEPLDEFWVERSSRAFEWPILKIVRVLCAHRATRRKKSSGSQSRDGRSPKKNEKYPDNLE
jgi:hypothetical protein